MSDFQPMPEPGQPRRHSDLKIVPKLHQIDDLFTEEVRDFIRHRTVDPTLSYGFFGPDRCRDIRLYDWHQFTHMVYDNDTEISALYNLLVVPLLTALDRTDRRLETLFKIRIVNSLPTDQEMNQPHIDLVGPHQTGLYFPEDSDSNTVVYQQRSWLQEWDTPETFDVAFELEPKANTWYDFDGTHWRVTGRPSKSQQRFCVIYNFIAQPKNDPA